MRLAGLGAILMCLSAQSVAANDPVARLSWDSPAPAGSEAVLTLRAQSGQTLTTLRADLRPNAKSHDIPLPALPRTAYSLQAGLVSAGEVILQGPITPLDQGLDDILEFPLTETKAQVFSDLWDCGDAGDIRLIQTADGFILRHDGQDIPFTQSEAARFAAADRTEFSITGTRAVLASPDMAEAVTCAPALQRPVFPIRAFGENPHWRIDLTPELAVIDLPGLEDETLQTAGMRISAPRDGSMTLRSTGLALRLEDITCRLHGIDLPYPVTAQLYSDAPTLAAQGCAGDPLDFLAGLPWRVETLLGLPLELPMGSAMTLQISDGQISGRGTCNRYLGRADASDGQLALRDLGTTRLTCRADLRNLELRFLDALEAATGFDISQTGRLTLRAGALPVLTALRQVQAR